MKKILILSLFLFSLYSYSQDVYKEINTKYYKLAKIDTVQEIVVTDGYFNVINDTIVNYLGGFGQYFYYEGERKNVNLSARKIEALKIKTYGIKEDI